MLPDKEKQRVMDAKNTFGSEQGRRVLDDLETHCGFKVVKLSVGSPDETAYWLGQREVYLYILRLIETDLSEVKQTLQETD